jgi:4'-phosphopantetheinyl transferase
VSATESIGPGECHLYVAEAPAALPPARVRAYERWLTPDEDARYRRFHFEKHRHLFLLTRALVRTTLSRYADVAPGDWRFTTNAHGKPSVSGPSSLPGLSFNLSNTEGLVVCLVAAGIDVGVDVENTERTGETVSIAEHFFAPSEVAALRALPRDLQRERFFAYWTLKESYIKARGLGLAIPLDQFAFVLEPQRIGIEFDVRLGDDPSSWQFARLDPGAPYALALAARRGAAPDLGVRVSRALLAV